MNYSELFAISAAGMDVERRRVEVAALNLANAHTVADASGRLFQPQRIVARGVDGAAGFDDLVTKALGMTPMATMESTQASPRKVHEPDHPMADKHGFISYPGVDTATEMLTIMGAIRSYGANVAAMNAARAMALKALDIGSGA